MEKHNEKSLYKEGLAVDANEMACHVKDILDGLSDGHPFNFKKTEEYFLSVLKRQR